MWQRLRGVCSISKNRRVEGRSSPQDRPPGDDQMKKESATSCSYLLCIYMCTCSDNDPAIPQKMPGRQCVSKSQGEAKGSISPRTPKFHDSHRRPRHCFGLSREGRGQSNDRTPSKTDLNQGRFFNYWLRLHFNPEWTKLNFPSITQLAGAFMKKTKSFIQEPCFLCIFEL